MYKVTLLATEVPNEFTIYEKHKPYLVKRNPTRVREIVNDSLWFLYQKVPNFDIEYSGNFIYLIIEGELTNKLAEEFKDNYGNGGPDTWMEGDISISETSELYLNLVDIKSYKLVKIIKPDQEEQYQLDFLGKITF